MKISAKNTDDRNLCIIYCIRQLMVSGGDGRNGQTVRGTGSSEHDNVRLQDMVECPAMASRHKTDLAEYSLVRISYSEESMI